MPAILVPSTHFTGSGKVFGRETDGLAAIVRGLAIDHARIKVAAENPAGFTDNSTGTDGGKLVELILPGAAFDATSAGGADRAAFNAATGKVDDAMAVIAEHLNDVRAPLGLTALTYAGTVAVADTIPAMDTSVAEAAGTSALDWTEGKARMTTAKTNLRVLARAYNQTLVASGIAPLASELTGPFDDAFVLDELTAAAASADGSEAVAKTVADAFLAGLANNVASIAAHWNAITWTAPALSVVAA